MFHWVSLLSRCLKYEEINSLARLRPEPECSLVSDHIGCALTCRQAIRKELRPRFGQNIL